MRLRTLAAVATALAVGGAAAFYVNERRAEKPNHRLRRKDGMFELRDYDPVLVATVSRTGAQGNALDSGFDRLAAYIFGKARSGHDSAVGAGAYRGRRDRIAMTAPVLQKRGETNGEWRIRFVMPSEYTLTTLPQPPEDIALDEIPARRMAAIQFSGSPDAEQLRQRQDELRRWCERMKLQPTGGFEYAFYNSPFTPPPLRRNEVLVPVSRR